MAASFIGGGDSCLFEAMFSSTLARLAQIGADQVDRFATEERRGGGGSKFAPTSSGRLFYFTL